MTTAQFVDTTFGGNCVPYSATPSQGWLTKKNGLLPRMGLKTCRLVVHCSRHERIARAIGDCCQIGPAIGVEDLHPSAIPLLKSRPSHGGDGIILVRILNLVENFWGPMGTGTTWGRSPKPVCWIGRRWPSMVGLRSTTGPTSIRHTRHGRNGSGRARLLPDVGQKKRRASRLLLRKGPCSPRTTRAPV